MNTEEKKGNVRIVRFTNIGEEVSKKGEPTTKEKKVANKNKKEVKTKRVVKEEPKKETKKVNKVVEKEAPKKKKGSGLAFGILSLVFFPFTLLGLIFGIVGTVKGAKRKAKGTLISSIIGLILTIGFVVGVGLYIYFNFDTIVGLFEKLIEQIKDLFTI